MSLPYELRPYARHYDADKGFKAFEVYQEGKLRGRIQQINIRFGFGYETEYRVQWKYVDPTSPFPIQSRDFYPTKEAAADALLKALREADGS